MALTLIGATSARSQQQKASVKNELPSLDLRSSSNLSFAQSSAYDWKEGEKGLFDIKLALNERLSYSSKLLRCSSLVRVNLGVQRETAEQYPQGILKPTDNELFSEYLVALPFGWKVDPYFSANVRTQVTESFRFVKDKATRTAKFWDPVTSQQAAGFTYELRGDGLSSSFRLGASFQQIRAREHTTLTDDPKTKDTKETYKADSGLELLNESILRLDSAVTLSSRIATRTTFQDLGRWTALWENEARVRAWKLLGVILTINLSHNPDQSRRVQFRQSLQLGLLYDF